jgi:hypothetical protein
MGKKDYENFKLNLNMKTILLYEEMSGKSFYEVGGDDIMLLIYCALVVNNDIILSFERFKIIMSNKAISKALISKCKDELDFIQQFTKNIEGGEKSEVSKVSPMVHMVLLQNNLNIDYVMYKMRLWEMPPLIKAIEEKTKVDLVEKRFWAYFNICPHIDNKKIKGPEDLIAFPWEKEGKKENALQYMEKNKNAIDAFFNNVKK